ncbi:MAG: glycoside hydrolase family 18 protein [Anaerolineaceae bacterium]|nr:glycoside hydrolase family 18 protein [Anaerolineaceae bacterium]
MGNSNQMTRKSSILIQITAVLLLLNACSPAASAVTKSNPVITAAATIQTTNKPAPSQTVTPNISPTVAEPGFCPQSAISDSNTLIIGYIPDYRELDVQWGNCLTDIIYSSVDFLPDGNLELEKINASILTTMQEMKQKYGTRIHISVGGMNRSANFSAVVTDDQNRDRFVKNLIQFADEYNLDGIDLDWEFPVTQAEIRGYAITMSALQKMGMIVSVALYPYEDINVKPYLTADRLLIMSYERARKHSTYNQAVKDLVYFSTLGAPKEKIFLGIPMYGRQMESPYHFLAYAEIVTKYSPLPEHVDEMDGIFFNGIKTVQQKTCYVIKNGYGGVMLWELGQDNGDLLKTIHQVVVSGCNK